ncbi:PGN_0703 family putative restriction endonuclease [Burkholderia pyrrocinia]|uniref:Restriction endonuclease n=1 Tax=Burkholderia pyrrocinia TaxID=60550 RepID=A0ABZ3BX37_BURPY
MDGQPFLSGIPVDHVLDRLAKAGGKEIESGKFSSPESSAALAVNCFGWFIDRPGQLPPLKGLEDAGVPELVDIEFCARFPWTGGRHPWLDAVVQTPRCLIGIESKRFEPFRDAKSVSLSDAYDRPVWGANMKGYERMRDRLRSGDVRYVHLDAAQLVKHAFGLVTEGVRRNRAPALFYLFAEPAARGGLSIAPDSLARHRDEIARFGEAVAGDAVTFHSASYREWLGTWCLLDSQIAAHGQAIIKAFEP